jgi:hypothetical protein
VLARPQLIDALPDKVSDRIDQMGAALVPADGEAADYLSRLNTEAVVIRPDRHILGIATNPVELEALLMQTPWQIADEVETLQRRPVVAAH